MGRNEREWETRMTTEDQQEALQTLWRYVSPREFEKSVNFEDVDQIHDLFTRAKLTPPTLVSRVLRDRIRERGEEIRDIKKYGNQ
jgi:hypothetical protein